MRLSWLLIAAALGGAVNASCKPPAPEPPPAPVPGQTVQDWMRDLPGEPGRAVYLRNDGRRPILITTLNIYQCVNVRQVCRTYTLNVVVEPGQTVQLMALQPQNQGAEYSFRYEYRWTSAP